MSSTPLKTLDGKVALVTGASSGIGRASALELARRGAKVIASARNAEALESLVAEIRHGGFEATAVRADINDEQDVIRIVERTVATYGRIDVAFNNAGVIEPFNWFHETPEDHWDRVIGVNLKGVWLCMKHEIPRMQAQGGGVIVNTGSIAGLIGLPTSSAYVAAKHGVLGLTKTAALEWAADNIRVNAVCPGTTKTPMFQHVASIFPPDLDPRVMDRLMMMLPGPAISPRELGESIVYLASPAARMITGAVFAHDGGMS